MLALFTSISQCVLTYLFEFQSCKTGACMCAPLNVLCAHRSTYYAPLNICASWFSVFISTFTFLRRRQLDFSRKTRNCLGRNIQTCKFRVNNKFILPRHYVNGYTDTKASRNHCVQSENIYFMYLPTNFNKPVKPPVKMNVIKI